LRITEEISCMAFLALSFTYKHKLELWNLVKEYCASNNNTAVIVIIALVHGLCHLQSLCWEAI
jgi:hypothetical protein